MKKITKVPPKRPETKELKNEYSIKEEDYQNISNIIMMCGRSMEKTAKSHYNHQEEELRDLLLSTLQTHYENATVETFSKLGKTDIHIPFENKAVYIAEYKIWHGESKFSEAIQQVLNYSKWRDRKLSVITFNKENKNFENIVSKIDNVVRNKSIRFERKMHNRWDCTIYDPEAGTDVQINVMVFNLYVDKSQFKDKRYE